MQTEQFSLHADIEDVHWWFVARRQILVQMIRHLIPPGKNKMLVDVGCGTGANISALSSDYRCVGIDTSEDAITLATERFPAVEFIRGFAPADLGPHAHEADLFLLTDVIEHVPDDFRLLSELMAASKPGAIFVVTVPALMSLWSPHDVAFGHYRRYDDARLRATWEGLPVDTKLLSFYNAKLYPVVRFIRSISKARGTSWGKNSTDFSLPNPIVNQFLKNQFASEGSALIRSLDAGSSKEPGSLCFGAGVSLIAVLERKAGDLPVRSKPDTIAADPFEPLRQREFADLPG